MWIPSWKQASNWIFKIAGYSHNRSATIAPMDSSWLATQSSFTQDPQMNKIADDNSSPLHAVRTSQQRRSSQPISSLVSLCQATRVHGIFNNRVLTTSSKQLIIFKWSFNINMSVYTIPTDNSSLSPFITF